MSEAGSTTDVVSNSRSDDNGSDSSGDSGNSVQVVQPRLSFDGWRKRIYVPGLQRPSTELSGVLATPNTMYGPSLPPPPPPTPPPPPPPPLPSATPPPHPSTGSSSGSESSSTRSAPNSPTVKRKLNSPSPDCPKRKRCE